jgi:hypothetical protein
MSDSNDRKSKQSAKISRRDVIKLSAGAAATRRAVESDLLYKLREDGNPLPVTINVDKFKKQ